MGRVSRLTWAHEWRKEIEELRYWFAYNMVRSEKVFGCGDEWIGVIWVECRRFREQMGGVEVFWGNLSCILDILQYLLGAYR